MQTNVVKSNTNIHSLHHQSLHYLTSSTATNHNTTNRGTLAKGQQPPVSMAGAGKGTLLLTTKDGQSTMVMQQQPTSASVADCSGGVTTINTSLNSVINSSASQVITINNRPLNSTMGSHQPQQILVSNTHGGMLSGNMVLNMNPSRPVTPTFVNAAAVGNQNGPRNMGPRILFNSPIRLGQQVITQRPAAPNLIGPVSHRIESI